MNKYYTFISVSFFLMGTIFSWLVFSKTTNEDFENINQSNNSYTSEIKSRLQHDNCSTEKSSIESLTNEILRLTKLNKELYSKPKEISINNIDNTSTIKASNTTQPDTSTNIELTTSSKHDLNEKETNLEEQNKLKKKLLDTNWKEKPEDLASIILSSESDEIYYASLVIAQEGFGYSDEYKINEVNMAIANIYSKTNNNELKYDIVRYLANIEPNLYDAIYSNISTELYAAINEYVDKNYP